MTEPTTLPTAAELGISERQYARIVGDLRRRQESAGPPAPPPLRPAKSRLLTGRRVAALVGVAVLVVVLRIVGSATLGAPAYAFTDTVGGKPVTYSSCRPIQVAVYPAGGPSDAEQLVREAVTKMRAATGLDIVVVGSFGGHAPNWNFKAAPITSVDPVSVSWQDGDAIAEMTDDVAGLGGSAMITSAYGTEQRVGGTIALSRDYYEQLAARGDHDEALAVLLHEFGHVFGLAHVGSRSELMYDRNIGRTTLGKGDLEGLRLLGQGPCI